MLIQNVNRRLRNCTLRDSNEIRTGKSLSPDDFRPNRSLTADYARLSGLLLKYAAGSGIELITTQRLLQRIATPLPIACARENHVIGRRCRPESVVTDLLDQRHFFQNLAQIPLWTALSCARYAFDLRGWLGEFSRTVAGGGGEPHDRTPLESPSTLPAHCSHIGKRANRETRVDTVRAG